jgi:predicted amidohydrolase
MTQTRPFSLADPVPGADTPLRVACIQLATTADRTRNHAAARAGLDRAASLGAELVVLPEKWSLIGEPAQLEAGAQRPDGSDVQLVREACVEHNIWCVAGSIALRNPGERLLRNTSLLVAPDGTIHASYDKMHMFDVTVGGIDYRESDAEAPGSEIRTVTLPLDDRRPWMLGMSVCYDLRFPELYRIMALRGATVITVPAAFTERTGRDHWSVLLRARAIENATFILAANAIGDHGGGKRSYGRSMIVDPWGVVLAQAGDDEAVIVADLDPRVLDDVRASIPALQSRVPAAYVWP